MTTKVRTKAVWTTGGWQAYENGPGVITHAFMDGTSLSSNVLTLYDSNRASTSDPAMAVWTQDTDFGTTIPVTCFQDGSVVTTLATESANTHLGLEFFDGVYIVKTVDTTHNASVKLLIRPLIKKSVNLGHLATTDTQRLFSGPGVVRAIRLTVGGEAVGLTTMDLLFLDGTNTLITATDYATAGPTCWYPVTTTGIDDVGAAVTTAATAAYANTGVAFFSSLNVSMAQGSATARNAQVDVLIEV